MARMGLTVRIDFSEGGRIQGCSKATEALVGEDDASSAVSVSVAVAVDVDVDDALTVNNNEACSNRIGSIAPTIEPFAPPPVVAVVIPSWAASTDVGDDDTSCSTSRTFVILLMNLSIVFVVLSCCICAVDTRTVDIMNQRSPWISTTHFCYTATATAVGDDGPTCNGNDGCSNVF
jgi:hypothetical protein